MHQRKVERKQRADAREAENAKLSTKEKFERAASKGGSRREVARLMKRLEAERGT